MVIKAPLTRRTVALGGRFAPAGPLRLRLLGQGKPPAPANLSMQRKPLKEYGNSTAVVFMCLRDASGGDRAGSRLARGNNAPLRWVGGYCSGKPSRHRRPGRSQADLPRGAGRRRRDGKRSPHSRLRRAGPCLALSSPGPVWVEWAAGVVVAEQLTNDYARTEQSSCRFPVPVKPFTVPQPVAVDGEPAG